MHTQGTALKEIKREYIQCKMNFFSLLTIQFPSLKAIVSYQFVVHYSREIFRRVCVCPLKIIHTNGFLHILILKVIPYYYRLNCPPLFQLLHSILLYGCMAIYLVPIQALPVQIMQWIFYIDVIAHMWFLRTDSRNRSDKSENMCIFDRYYQIALQRALH